MSGRTEVCRFFLQGRCRFGDSCKNLHPGAGGDGGLGRGGGGSSGGVCRFFLQGRCKFGDRCRDLHPGAGGGGGPGRGRGGNRHQPDPRVDTGRGWNQKQGGNLFRYLNDSGSSGSGYNSGSRFDQNYRNSGGGQRSPNAFGSSAQYSNTGSRDSGFRSDDGIGFAPSGWSGTHASGYGGGLFDSRGRGGRGGDGGRYYRQQSSTDSGLGAADPITARDVAQVIQQDMNDWPACGMWPLSCYAYKKDGKCLPRFSDISPEELRWEAYQAKLSGKTESYMQSIGSLGEAQMKTWREYGTITEEDAAKLLSAETSEPFSLLGSSSSPLTSTPFQPLGTLFGSSSSGKQSSTTGPLFEGMFGSSQSSGQPAGSLFGSGGGILLKEGQALFGQNTTAQQPSSFQLGGLGSNTGGLAPPQGPQPLGSTSGGKTGTALSDGPAGTGAATAEEQLTEEELDAFKADKFVLGHIPERAPPTVFC